MSKNTDTTDEPKIAETNVPQASGIGIDTRSPETALLTRTNIVSAGPGTAGYTPIKHAVRDAGKVDQETALKALADAADVSPDVAVSPLVVEEADYVGLVDGNPRHGQDDRRDVKRKP